MTRAARRPTPRYHRRTVAELRRGRRAARRPRRRWGVLALVGLLGPVLVMAVVLTYLFVTFTREVDRFVAGTRSRAIPQVYARTFTVTRGQFLTDRQLVERLNELGYTQRAPVANPGEFAIGRQAIALVPRAGDHRGRIIRVVFEQSSDGTSGQVQRIEVLRAGTTPTVTLDTPLLTAVARDAREKQRQVPLAQIPLRMQQAVLAIEDRRFYSHPGLDVVRTIGAALTNVRGDRPYLVGASTLTQQLVKNSFLTPEKSYWRKLQEAVLSVILERRLRKDVILELYLNDVYLGQRGSFALRGVAEASRLFFGKDVTNLTLSEAATIAGVIQSPTYYSPFRHRERARNRRNVVLRAMADSGFITREAADRAAGEPLIVQARALDAEAPYFVDYVMRLVGQTLAGPSARAVAIHTTLDVHLQRLAQEAVSSGLTRVDRVLARRGRGPAQAALIAVDPRTADILALVGGRWYNTSQYNRAVSARRQPGSIFKPFVYLAAFERARTEQWTDLTPATIVTDEPTTFVAGAKTWTPANYQDEYDGPITLRRALARSRNVATIKVAERTGYDRIAEIWRRASTRASPRPYPAITLGVFETTPLEIAEAYTLFANLGEVRSLRAIERVLVDDRETRGPREPRTRPVASPQATFLVTSMMRSVLDDGTGAAARRAGFRIDAAGKSGTTNDLRDAWFVGFTPELLTVVWVGLDDNTPLGMSGTSAALPIWTTFMQRALAGHARMPFAVPSGITFAEIDPETGERAGPRCPTRINEAFLQGTEPTTLCQLHHHWVPQPWPVGKG
ncbi:MAG: PBP1A family penicillin-binding protein [Luteitalea sp.]|nr:PBP1A family penicillin-binding protein [Luteitalea sp.]